jgi:hypothetical protein
MSSKIFFFLPTWTYRKVFMIIPYSFISEFMYVSETTDRKIWKNPFFSFGWDTRAKKKFCILIEFYLNSAPTHLTEFFVRDSLALYMHMELCEYLLGVVRKLSHTEKRLFRLPCHKFSNETKIFHLNCHKFVD